MTTHVRPTRSTVPLSAVDRRLLIEIGFLAAGAGNVVCTDAIFAGLAADASPGVAHLLGPALARLNAGRAEEALAYLPASGSNDDAALAPWRAVALRQAGRAEESRRLLRRLSCDNTPAGRLVSALVGDPPGRAAEASR